MATPPRSSEQANPASPTDLRTVLRQLRSLLGDSDTRRFTSVLVAILVMAVFEAFAVASVLPFLQVVAKPELLQQHALLNWIPASLGPTSDRELLIIMGIAVISVVALSALISAYTTWLISHTVWGIAHRLSMRLVENYVGLPYQHYLRHNSATFLRKVTSDASDLIHGVLLAGTQMIAYALVSLVIILVIVLVQPVVAGLILFLFGGSYALIHSLQRRYVARLGRQRIAAVDRRLRTFSETLLGIKALRTEGVAPYFVARFDEASRAYTHIQPRYELAMKLPRFAIEFLAVAGIITTILYLLTSGRSFLDAAPILGLFAMASFRLLPALHQTFYKVTQVSHFLPAVEQIYRELSLKSELESDPCQGSDAAHGPQQSGPDQAEHMRFRHHIHLAGVDFRYHGAEHPALQPVEMKILAQQRTALVGPTGCGKTTLADLVIGLMPPAHGSISIDGQKLTPQSLAAWRRRVAYVPQEVFLYDASIAANIAFGIPFAQIDHQRLHDVARLAQIHDFITQQLPDGYQTEVGERGERLSGGQRQRIGLARAFYRRPDLLVLDEATSALDSVTEDAFMTALKQQRPDLTVLMIAHRLSTVRGCDQIHLLDQGRIVASGDFNTLYGSSPQFRQMVDLGSTPVPDATS